jgi:hypothetical protein
MFCAGGEATWQAARASAATTEMANRFILTSLSCSQL